MHSKDNKFCRIFEAERITFFLKKNNKGFKDNKFRKIENCYDYFNKYLMFYVRRSLDDPRHKFPLFVTFVNLLSYVNLETLPPGILWQSYRYLNIYTFVCRCDENITVSNSSW